MSFNVPQLANTATFLAQFNTINLLANIVSNIALTVGSNTSGSAGVTNNFYAYTLSSIILNTNSISSNSLNTNSISSNLVFFGNTTTNVSINSTSFSISNPNSSLTILTPNTVQISNGQFFLNANGSYSTVPSVAIPVVNTQVVTNTTFTQQVDYWAYGQYNSANYNILVIDNISNNYYSSKFSLLLFSNNVITTEYAQLTSNSFMGTFTATTNATGVILNFAPTSNSTTVRLFRELI